MKHLVGFVILAMVLVSPGFAAQHTWVGKISDSDCGAKHMASAEHQSEMSDAACTMACIEKGAKYVFVNDGKILNISNQDFADLPKHAGHKVNLTGEMTDGSIRVFKIEMPKEK